MSDLKTKGTKAVLNDPKTSAFTKYRRIAVGDAGFGYLLFYEWMNMFSTPLPHDPSSSGTNFWRNTNPNAPGKGMMNIFIHS